MDTIKKDLLVPTKYIKVIDGRICLTVHRNWLTNLQTVGPISFLNHERLSDDEIAAQPMLDELGPDWMRIYVRVYEKQHKYAVPLPRGRHTSGNTQADLTFSQLMHYVAETNYRNLWKECYKKYYSPWNCIEQRDQCNITANVSDTSIMQEVLQKMYGCILIQIQNGLVVSVSPGISNEVHCNLLPILCAVETTSAFLTLHEQTAEYSVRECVMYSPAALSMSHGKPLFLIYQLLQLSRDLHDRGLVLGEITLSDILLMDNFTIQVLPKLSDNIYLKPEHEIPKISTAQETKGKGFNGHIRNFDMTSSIAILRGNPEFGMNENIEKLCEMWVYSCISNYDYLTALNNMAGRRYGDPSCHHVMPWVTDFTSRCGGNWRDLTKSKFRLNKGDRQLDLTFDSQSTEVGHHVSDVLSEITYYVYLSRRYDKSVLCKYVRPQWVPGEYPASIQRLHDWSPDECIPQFFTDPSVFKSIHEDLPDLEIPGWATSPEDFIERHREALESFHVSERLHHWIDLTFGYKLSGSAAIKSKNVCLQLVDNHTRLTNAGVVQLFTQPHPQKIIPSPYWCKIPPRLRSSFIINKYKNDQSGNRTSDDEGHSSGFEEEELPTSTLSTSRSSPLVLSRLLSRSRGSLLSTEDTVKQDKSMNQTIILPKDYNPVTAIMQVETIHVFMNKVSSQVYKPEIEVHELSTNYKQIVASGRIKEQQILGCLIVEIFLSNKFRATWNIEKMSFPKRLTTCINTLKMSADGLPKCVRNAVALLLQVDIIPSSYNIDNIEVTDTPFRYPTVTYMGLPPPSAHQFLQPILSGSLFPFSKYYKHLFNIVEMLQEYNSLVRELNFIMKAEDDMDFILKTKTKFLCKISECKVKAIASELEHLLSHTGIAREACLELIVPHIQQIMEEPYSAVLAAWYLFDPIAKALGPKDTAQTFLLPIMKLYENGFFMDTSSYADIFPPGLLAKFKTTRLYHRNFLLKLMVRLGLRRFLENFITPLVEAVGGYRDYIQGCLTYIHKTGNLKTCDLSGTCNEGEGILSPLDEDFSVDSEQNMPLSPGPVSNDYARDTSTNDNDVEGLYGEQIIVLQYFAHMVELLALCKRKLTQNLEGGLISCLTLLNHITPYLSDAVLMDVLHESIVKAILYPTVRILSSTRFTFPNGVIARNVMAEKCLETLFMFSLRLGSIMTRNHLAVPIQRFFLAFDKSFNQSIAESYKNEISQKTISEHFTRIKVSNEENRDALAVQSNFNADVADSYSPPATENMDISDLQKNKALEELRAVFTAEFAHKTYMLFYKCIDSEIMEQILKNHEHIHNLCRKYEQEAKITCSNTDDNKFSASCNSNYNMMESTESVNKDALNFGNISVVGNRFAVQKNNIGDHIASESSHQEANYSSSTGRQLRGNWLAYWEHEIGRSEKDTAFNIKQIKLQTFSGHTNSIKCLSVLDNENSFMSGGRDKTVKLWSLRSQGDGNTVSSCQYTYTGHKKSILALTFLESLRYVVTCDSTIHCWDPFMGSLLGCPESSRPVPVNTLIASPSPCTTLLAGTTDITLRVIDCRSFQYVNEMKVSVNPTGLIRCIAVAPSGYWVALGQASGFLTILDIRTGLIIASWKGHECEILQLEAINETTIISSSLDETIAVWSALDGKLKFHMKGSTEPVHCMSTYEQELIIGTTANRVGVYSSIETTAVFSSSKLKSDTFKGLLTTMAVLPLNRLLLLGADNGGITLIC
nr:PREDICTED: WD repeat-containing protein 81 isoform X4 [Megachile rotundata]